MHQGLPFHCWSALYYFTNIVGNDFFQYLRTMQHRCFHFIYPYNSSPTLFLCKTTWLLVCFRFLSTWIGEMSVVGEWNRFMNSWLQRIASFLVLINPNVSAVKGKEKMFELRKIWRKVCFHIQWRFFNFYLNLRISFDIYFSCFYFSANEMTEDISWPPVIHSFDKPVKGGK